MLQLLLPLFPTDIRLLTPYTGVREQAGLVHYLLNGLPIYSHSSTDHLRFRYITSHLLLQGLCKNQDTVDLFHVSHDSVRRWKKKLSEEGTLATPGANAVAKYLCEFLNETNTTFPVTNLKLVYEMVAP